MLSPSKSSLCAGNTVPRYFYREMGALKGATLLLASLPIASGQATCVSDNTGDGYVGVDGESRVYCAPPALGRPMPMLHPGPWASGARAARGGWGDCRIVACATVTCTRWCRRSAPSACGVRPRPTTHLREHYRKTGFSAILLSVFIERGGGTRKNFLGLANNSFAPHR